MFSSYSAYLVTRVAGLSASARGRLDLFPARHTRVAAATAELPGPHGTARLAWRRTGGVLYADVVEGDPVDVDCGGRLLGGGVIRAVAATDGNALHSGAGPAPALPRGPAAVWLESRCRGRANCTLTLSDAAFGGAPRAPGAPLRSLAIRAECTGPPGLWVAVTVPFGAVGELHVPPPPGQAGVPYGTVTEGQAVLLRGGQRGPQGLPPGVRGVEVHGSGEVTVRLGGGSYEVWASGSAGDGWIE